MRDPRPGTAWSVGRARRRTVYAAWIASAGWARQRDAWLAEWDRRHPGRPPVCAACGGPWDPRHGDLHHRDYRRLGAEAFADLVPLDRDCHDQLHELLERAARPPRTRRAQASDAVVAHLRNTHRQASR